MAIVTDLETARRMVDEEFALTKIVSVEFVDEDRVVIHARRDTDKHFGFYKLTLTARDGRLDWATEFHAERPLTGPLQRAIEGGLRWWDGEPVIEAPLLVLDDRTRTTPHGDPFATSGPGWPD